MSSLEVAFYHGIYADVRNADDVITQVVYFIPSLVALSASRRQLKKPFWYQMLLVLSALAVLVMAGGFTYSTFHPKNGNRTNLTDDFGPNF